MPVASAQEAVSNYLRAMSAPQTAANYTKGIQATTVNPMEEAAKQEDYYLQRVTQASQSGRRVAALRAANPATWKENAIKVGAQRLGTGGQKAAPKMQSYAQKFQPVWQAIHDTVKAMPKGGLANAQARSAMTIQMMMQAAGTA